MNDTKDLQKFASERALANAKEGLREVLSRNQEVSEVATSLRVFRERNHFAERLRSIMKGE